MVCLPIFAVLSLHQHRTDHQLAPRVWPVPICPGGARPPHALAETLDGRYQAELIYRQSWNSREAVEMAAQRRVHWYNHQRRLSSIGYILPAEAEANVYQQQTGQAMAA